MAETTAEARWKSSDNWLQFYGLWFKVSLTHAWSIAEAVGFGVVIVVPLILLLFPKMRESTLAPFGWEVPLAVFALVGLIRLLCAPYWIYRDRHRAACTHEGLLRKEIAQLTAPRRTKAEQHNYDKAKKCLTQFGEKAAIALRHLKTCGSLTVTAPGMSNSVISSFLPPNITLAELNWALGACAGEGVITCREPMGGTQRIYEIAKTMDAVLDELLYEEPGFGGLANV
jgi:hypothetical protein